MGETGTWLDHVRPALIYLREEPHSSGWLARESSIRYAEESDGDWYVQDLALGVSLRLQQVDVDTLSVVGWALSHPVPNDAELVSLGLHCLPLSPPVMTLTVGAEAAASWTAEEIPSMKGVANLLTGLLDTVSRQRDGNALQAAAPDITLDWAGGALPFQAFGTWMEYPFYFRYRGGWASLDIGMPGGDPLDPTLWSAGVHYGEALSGWLDFSEFVLLLTYLSQRLEVAQYPFHFRVTSIPGEPDAADSVQVGDTITLWGRTAQDAYESLSRTRWHAWGVERTPVNRDVRLFPDVAPTFHVAAAALSEAEELIAASPASRW